MDLIVFFSRIHCAHSTCLSVRQMHRCYSLDIWTEMETTSSHYLMPCCWPSFKLSLLCTSQVESMRRLCTVTQAAMCGTVPEVMELSFKTLGKWRFLLYETLLYPKCEMNFLFFNVLLSGIIPSVYHSLFLILPFLENLAPFLGKPYQYPAHVPPSSNLPISCHSCSKTVVCNRWPESAIVFTVLRRQAAAQML